MQNKKRTKQEALPFGVWLRGGKVKHTGYSWMLKTYPCFITKAKNLHIWKEFTIIFSVLLSSLLLFSIFPLHLLCSISMSAFFIPMSPLFLLPPPSTPPTSLVPSVIRAATEQCLQCPPRGLPVWHICFTAHLNLHSLHLLWSDYRGSNRKYLPRYTQPDTSPLSNLPLPPATLPQPC